MNLAGAELVEVEVKEPERTDADLGERLNLYSALRDQLRTIDTRLSSGLDHTQRPLIEKQQQEKHSQIRTQTEWIRSYRTDILAPRYRETILAIATAKTKAAEKQAELSEAEKAIGVAEKNSYNTWLLLRNTARAAGQEIPPRFDMPRPKRHTGQLSTWTPGI